AGGRGDAVAGPATGIVVRGGHAPAVAEEPVRARARGGGVARVAGANARRGGAPDNLRVGDARAWAVALGVRGLRRVAALLGARGAPAGDHEEDDRSEPNLDEAIWNHRPTEEPSRNLGARF